MCSSDLPVTVVVGRLDLAMYKATIKGLTQFGDRRQGTDRNRAAVDWIESQLKSYGCTNTERIQYQYTGLQIRPAAAQGTNRAAAPAGAVRPTPLTIEGGGRPRGIRAATGVNLDPELQADLKLREINAQPDSPGSREEVFDALHAED